MGKIESQTAMQTQIKYALFELRGLVDCRWANKRNTMTLWVVHPAAVRIATSFNLNYGFNCAVWIRTHGYGYGHVQSVSICYRYGYHIQLTTDCCVVGSVLKPNTAKYSQNIVLMNLVNRSLFISLPIVFCAKTLADRHFMAISLLIDFT